jgi:hypothetical protein
VVLSKWPVSFVSALHFKHTAYQRMAYRARREVSGAADSAVWWVEQGVRRDGQATQHAALQATARGSA